MYIWERVRNDPSILVDGITQPRATALEVNRLYHQLRGGQRYNAAGTDVFENEDWDNLILLDACRWDEYAAQTPLEGRVETRESRGSASKQFVRGNFGGKTLHDTVYVSGNQWYLKLRDELGCELHRYHNVDRDSVGGRVPAPATMSEAAEAAAEEFPHKRLIVHYMQPHRPYLGDRSELFTGDSNDGRIELREIDRVIRSGRADRDDLVAAYRDNLRLVLEAVEALLPALVGKTVISSDHGELLWDRTSPIPVRWYGHPDGVYVDSLVTVPWHVVSEGPRRRIVAEPPEREIAGADAADVEANLRDLGYL